MVSFIQSIYLRETLQVCDCCTVLVLSVIIINALLHVLVDAVYVSPYLLMELLDIQICFLFCPIKYYKTIMKAEDCVKLISRRAQVSYLSNQITKFEIVFTKNISILVGLLTDHTNCSFFFCTGSVSWLSNHVSKSLCPTHP